MGLLSPVAVFAAEPTTIVKIDLPSEETETRPLTVPTEPENTVEIDFPWPVDDWAGRGFTPDPEKYAGDFVVEAARGRSRMFVTPVTAQAHRVLHVVLAAADGRTRSITIELIPSPPGLAWHKVVFAMAAPVHSARGPVSLADRPPRSGFRDPSPESEIGMVRMLRLLLNATADDASSVVAANPALEFSVQQLNPHSFGDFTITNRYALRDTTTGTLGLCVSVANATTRRLLFDPQGWVVRAGGRVYPVRTLDFGGELEPGAESAAFLVLAGGSQTGSRLLLPDNAFEVSAILSGSVNPRAVSRIAVEGLGP